MDRMLPLLCQLIDADVVTYTQLSQSLKVTSRTIFNDVTKLNALLKHHGAKVISKPHVGLWLEIDDRSKFDIWLIELKKADITASESVESRVYKILTRLISINRFIKMDDLCEELFISRSTLKNDLKKIRAVIAPYHLRIVVKSYEGIRLIGSEHNVRRCLAKIRRHVDTSEQFIGHQELQRIEQILKDVFHQYHYKMSEFAFHNLMIHLYIAITRIQMGSVLTDVAFHDMDCDETDYQIAEEIIRRLEAAYQIVFLKSELQYVAIHLESKKMLVNSANTVVSAQIYEIVVAMLKAINTTFSVDFRHDFELITLLSLHLTPLRVRLMYDLTFENPLMAQIREHFPFAYEMAIVASNIMRERYDTDITGDEIAYIALHFNVAIERKRKRLKKNVMIVCGTGRGSAELLAFQVKETYGAYIHVVKTHESIDFSDIDFHEIDYVLTTVHIHETIPVPIIEIKGFLDQGQDELLQRYLHTEDKNQTLHHFTKDLFKAHITLDNKASILKLLCDMAADKKEVSDDFYDLVLKRETMGSTSFGNYIAIPHPYTLIGKESFVVVGILETPIYWDGELVQIIFLLSMKEQGDERIHGFYKMISTLLMNKVGVQQIIGQPTFEQLMAVLS